LLCFFYFSSFPASLAEDAEGSFKDAKHEAFFLHIVHILGQNLVLVQLVIEYSEVITVGILCVCLVSNVVHFNSPFG
jgi:hypothetical protein